MNIVLIVIAIFLLILIPVVPKLVRLKIRFLRWIHWNWTANLLENHFDEFVLIRRIMILVIAAVLLYIGLEDLRN